MSIGRPIYTDQDERRINEALRTINELLPILDDAEACGMDCQSRRQQLETTRRNLEEIRTRFIVTQNSGARTARVPRRK